MHRFLGLLGQLFHERQGFHPHIQTIGQARAQLPELHGQLVATRIFILACKALVNQGLQQAMHIAFLLSIN